MAKAMSKHIQEWFDDLPPAQRDLLNRAPSPQEIARLALEAHEMGKLQMGDWYSRVGRVDEPPTNECDTALCLAGWAMDASGIKYDFKVGTFLFPDGNGCGGYEEAGAYLLELDDYEADIFYATNQEAVNFIRDRWGL